MASADALSSLLRDVPETVIGDNPYVAMAKSFAAQQQNVAPARNNLEAFLVPLIQNSALGVMQGLAANREKDNLFDYYKSNPLIQALASNAPEASTIGPVADGEQYAQMLAAAPLAAYQQKSAPPGWTPEQGKGDLFKALIGYQAQQEQQKAISELAQFTQKEKIKQNIKSVAEQSKETGKDWIETLGEQEKRQVNQGYAMINSLDSVASKMNNLTDNTVSWQVNRFKPDTPEFYASRDLLTLVSPIVRSLGEVGALSEPEQARALDIIKGNVLSSPKDVGDLLNQLKTRVAQINKDRLIAAKIAKTEGGDALLNKFTQAATIPMPKPNPLDYASGEAYKAAKAAWRAQGGS